MTRANAEFRNPPGVKLTLFIDPVSQPVRAILGFVRLNGIKHEIKQVALRKGEHMSEEISKLNPAKQVPFLHEENLNTGEVLTMSESHAMMRYLAVSRGCADHWYPADLRERAKVNEYLDQHHNFLRQGVGTYGFKKFFAPVTGRSYTDKELDIHVVAIRRSLTLLEHRLATKPYLTGNQPTIADISAACELDSGMFFDLNLSNFPKTKAWLYRMVDADPMMMELSEPIRKLAKTFVEKAKKEGTFVKLDIKPSMEYGFN